MATRRGIVLLASWACLIAIFTSHVQAQTRRDPQSPARPFGYQPSSFVFKSGSDERSERFNKKYLPKVMEIVNERFKEGARFENPEAVPLNVERMVLNYDYDVRAYFIHEGAGYKNTVGVKLGDEHRLMFPDCSYDGNNGVQLQRGDFMDLGLIKRGTKLDLMIIPNGANGGLGGNYYRLYSTRDISDDKRQHYVGFWIEDTPLLLFGAEDLLGGGDNDFEDVVVVMDFGLDYAPPKNYFVSTRGDDANNGLSSSTAFRTIGKAAAMVRPGDTVTVAAGTYTENPNFRISGTDLYPIRFVAQGKVVLQSAQQNAWLMNMQYADYYIFEGFQFSGRNMPDNVRCYGPYLYHSDVTFSKCEFDKLYYGVHGQYTGTKLVGCYIHDCDGYAAMNHYGGLDINGCNITNNANGPRSYRDHYFAIKNSRIEKTSSWAIMCAFDPYGTHQPFGANTPLVSNCEIVDSGNGVHLAMAKPKDFIRFVNSTIRNVAGWQLGIDDSELTINPEWMKLWPFEGEKRHGLLTWQSKLSVFDLVLEGYSGQAFYSRSDELTMSNCISRMNGQGLDVYYPKRADLKNVQIINNNVANTSGWGLRLWVNDDSPATLRNCVIDGNRYGAYIYGATDSTLRLINTSISNNVSYGAYCERSEVILTPATMETRWRLKNNGYGVVCNYGRLSMEDVTMADCSGWAVMAHHSDVSIRNCNFVRNGNGAYLYRNRSADVHETHFDDNSNHGLWISHNKTYRDYDEAARQWRDFDTPNVAQVVNCTMDRNNYGLYLQDCTESTIRMADSPIRENRSAGLYVNSSRFVFNPESMQRMFQMENNQNFIYAGNGEYVFENLQVTDAKGYGLHTWYSAVTLRNCDFARNGNTGYYSYYDKSVDAQACRFHENRSFGLRVYCDGRYYNSGQGEWLKNDGPLKFIQCDIANNNHGVHIEGASLPMIQFVDTPIHGNENYGLYAIKCELNFNRTTMAQNWKLYDNGYHIVAGYGKYNFRNLDFSDAKRCGVSTHYSDVIVRNCQFERNGTYGLQSYYNKSFDINNCRINENGSYGLLLYHGKYYGLENDKWDWYPTTTIATIRNTPIENNKSYGLYIENCTEDSVSVINSPIRGNGSAGLYAVRSTFEFSPRTLSDKWQLSDNGSHIYAAWGTYVFKDLNLTGAPSYGVATWGSDVTVSNCSFSGNGSYGFQSHYNNPCVIENSKFDNNRWAGISFRNDYKDGQGVQHAGPIEMRNCSISGNHVGIYLPNCRTDMNPIKIVNTPIRDNTGWGVYFNSSQVALNPSSYPMSWQLEGNANNFLIYHGETRIDNVKITGSKGWGAYVVYSDAVVKNSSFSGNGNGLYLHANAQSVVENCDFDDNANWGLWVRPYYGYDSTNSDGTVKRIEYTGPVTLTNISSQRNGYAGLGMYDYTVDRDLVELKNVTLADNKGPGIHFYYLNGTLDKNSFGQFAAALKQNGQGMYIYYSDAVLDGLSIRGNNDWGCYAHDSRIQMANCTFSNNGRGFYWYPDWSTERGRGLTLDVTNCHFDENKNGQGLLAYWGLANISNCTFNGNYDGLYTGYARLAKVRDCEMKGNSRWGVVLHVNYAKWNSDASDERRQWYFNSKQTLENCVVDGNASGVFAYNAENGQFGMKNVDITNNRGQGLYLNECRLVWDTQQVDDVVIKDNDYGLYAIGANQSDITLRNVSLQNCRYMGLCNYAGKMSAENVVVTGGLYGVYWYRPKGLDVVKCRFEGSRPSENGWAAHGYGAPATNDLTAVRIRNSVFNNYHNGIYTYLYGDEGYQPNYEVYNNTFAKLQYWGAYADRGSKPVIRNNIFARAPKTVGGNGLGQNLGAGALLTHSHNLLSGFATSFYNGVIDAEHTTVVNEVRFVDETSGDFHLAKGSPAINAGTDLRLDVPTDMDGNPRPAYKAFEIGAYEYTEPEGSLRILSWTEEK